MEPLKENLPPMKDEKKPSNEVILILNGEMNVLKEELSKKQRQSQKTEVVLSLKEEVLLKEREDITGKYVNLLIVFLDEAIRVQIHVLQFKYA